MANSDSKRVHKMCKRDIRSDLNLTLSSLRYFGFLNFVCFNTCFTYLSSHIIWLRGGEWTHPSDTAHILVLFKDLSNILTHSFYDL